MIFQPLPYHTIPTFPSNYSVHAYKNIRGRTIGYTALAWKKNQKEIAYAKPFFHVHENKLVEAWPQTLPLFGMEQPYSGTAYIHDNEPTATELRALLPHFAHFAPCGHLQHINKVSLSHLGHYHTLINNIKNPLLHSAVECQLHNQNVKNHQNRLKNHKSKYKDFNAILTFASTTIGIYTNSNELTYTIIRSGSTEDAEILVERKNIGREAKSRPTTTTSHFGP
jgi:hypothetical protein